MLGRPVLSLVPTPTRARRAPFVVLILGILLLGLIGLLLLNTASAQDAFRLHRLQIAAANVNDERQALSERVNQLTGPAGLAVEAQKLGMVPVEAPAFWKPGDPLPPGARVLDGIVVVPAAGPPPAAPAPAATTSVPANPADAAVTAMPRPGQKAATSKPTTKPSTKPGVKPSTSTGASSRTPSTSSTGRQTPESRATAGSTSKPSTSKPKSSAGTGGAGR
jgi:hypothetical protein